MNAKLAELSEKVQAIAPEKIKTFVGYDGFIDTAVHAVDTRTGADTYERIRTIGDYGRKFIEAAGLSMNIEMVPLYSKVGGIAMILANSLSTLGVDMTYIGACGKDAIHPVFQEFAKRAKVYSISDPAQSDAIEFQDGKVISSKLEALKDVNWDNLQKTVSHEFLANLLDESALISFGGWALSINVTSIWKGIIKDVFPLMKGEKKNEIFFDLSDPAKRTKEDIMDALDVIRAYREKFVVGMGFNEKESFEIAELYGKGRNDFSSMLQVAEFLKEKLELPYVVVHPVKEACGAQDSGSARVDGPYCADPKLTTGAGDNFNAGFLLGRMSGFSMEEALLTGTANSGFYVRNARSATKDELAAFISSWSKGAID